MGIFTVLGDQNNRQTTLKTHTTHKGGILNTCITAVTPEIRKVRRALLTRCESRSLHGAKVSVTAMGLGISPSAYEKHRIKQAAPLLSDKHSVNEQ